MSAIQDNAGDGRGRKASVFNKMFDGFKFGEKKERVATKKLPSQRSTTVLVGETSKKGSVTVKEVEKVEHKTNTTKGHLSPDPSADHHKHRLAHNFVDVFRRGSEASTQSRSSSPVRGASVSSGRKLSMFRSSNPDDEMDIPCRNSSVGSAGGANGAPITGWVPRNAATSFLSTATLKTAEERERLRESISAAAASSGLGSAEISGSRQASVARSEGSSDGQQQQQQLRASVSGTSVPMTSTRRPSGMLPNNVASRYMRSASVTDEEKAAASAGSRAGSQDTTGSRTPNTRRRSSNRSRQNSGEVKPVLMAPELHAQWQNSVNMAQLRNNSTSSSTANNTWSVNSNNNAKPAPPAASGPESGSILAAHKIHVGMADVAEETSSVDSGSRPGSARGANKAADALPSGGNHGRTKLRKKQQPQVPTINSSPTFQMHVQPASPPPTLKGRHHQLSGVVGPVDNTSGSSNKTTTGQFRSLDATFGPSLSESLRGANHRGEEKGEVDELEALGFNGAIKA